VVIFNDHLSPLKLRRLWDASLKAGSTNAGRRVRIQLCSEEDHDLYSRKAN